MRNRTIVASEPDAAAGVIIKVPSLIMRMTCAVFCKSDCIASLDSLFISNLRSPSGIREKRRLMSL